VPALGQIVQLTQGAEVAEEALGRGAVRQAQDGVEKVARVFGAPLGGVVGHGLLVGVRIRIAMLA